MRLHMLAFSAAFALAACATSNGDITPEAETPAPEAPAEMAPPPTEPATPGLAETCKADAAQAFVGQQATDDVVEQARVASGSNTTRVIKPGMPVTMDFHGDRLNVNLDANGKIESLSCG